MPKSKNKGVQGKGKGWHGDSEGHAEAGKKGGETTYSEYGQEFYSEIGSLGGSVSSGNFANDPQRASKAGKKGGQKPKSDRSDELVKLEEDDGFW